MKTEQGLKDQCTPEFIKFLCELAEGFEYKGKEVHGSDDCIWFGEEECPIYLLYIEFIVFSTLIHRAVEGWNRNNKSSDWIDIDNVAVYRMRNLDEVLEEYKFDNYQPQSLTSAECAMLHCLLDIFKGERR